MSGGFGADSGINEAANKKAFAAIDRMEANLNECNKAKKAYNDSIQDNISEQAGDILRKTAEEINKLKETLHRKFDLYEEANDLLKKEEDDGIGGDV